MDDRRTSRSSVPHEAGSLFFQAVAARHGLEALTLTSEDGLLVVGTQKPGGPALDLEWIGALGCVCAIRGRRGPSLSELVERATEGKPLEAKELTVRGERLYLVSVGGPLPEEPEVVAGIERILSRSLAAAA